MTHDPSATPDNDKRPAHGADAVRVESEHRDGGPAIAAVAPYRRKGLRTKTVTYGALSALSGTRRVWLAD